MTHLIPHPLERGAFPSWASSIADTIYGPQASISVGDVTYNFRWIPPGSFWMGAGEQEPEDWAAVISERPRHRVRLTEGFWVGETPCPQSLWEAVMGENPSVFVDPNRPVEQVSWEDIQTFFQRLEGHCPGLGARLPTEAQWEYAARAGTETATYAGELDLLGARNAPVLNRIAWYGGNSGLEFDLTNGVESESWPEKQYPHTRAGTRPLGLRRPNAWGLYDMLGNVWEWCQDGPRSYAEGFVTDPIGSIDMGSDRVFRGGGWQDGARDARAASRLADEPSYRNADLGFRISRGW